MNILIVDHFFVINIDTLFCELGQTLDSLTMERTYASFSGRSNTSQIHLGFQPPLTSWVLVGVQEF